MKSLTALVLLVIVAASGCSSSVAMKGEPALVTGKVAKSDGKPVGNVLLTLQPLEDGHLTPLEVGGDGCFQGELVPGKYAFYVGKSSKSKASVHSLRQVSSKFFEPDMSRTVVVSSGSDLTIALD